MRRILSVLCLLMLTLMLILPSSEGFAQKKSTKSETTTVQTTPKSAEMFKDWLVQHVGRPSNHGTLQKVGPDYVVFDDEGTETFVPIAMIQSVTVKKEQEDEESPVKIVLAVKLLGD